jgi:NADPH-dependent curcumin reductase CurA
MSDSANRQIVLAARPVGEPKPGDFRLVAAPVPEPREGEVLVRTIWLSLDPYMRGRMNAGRSYARSVAIGEVMVGQTVGRVVASQHPRFRREDLVLAYGGWQDYALLGGAELRKLSPMMVPPTIALGVLGMPGRTAYGGLLVVGRPRPGETVAVAAASGAVGSLVGQIAKLKGCRAVGIAGGEMKCRYLVEELGFDAAVDRHAENFAARLRDACPAGIDVYFENVGGAVWNAVLPLLNDFARVPVCGLVAHYNDTELPPGPDRSVQLMRHVLAKRLTLHGFIVSDFAELGAEFRRDVFQWLREGRIKYREDIVAGLENAPDAFIGLLRGRNFGKLLVQVSAD